MDDRCISYYIAKKTKHGVYQHLVLMTCGAYVYMPFSMFASTGIYVEQTAIRL